VRKAGGRRKKLKLMDVKTLDLTERDFQLLVEALDYLPEKIQQVN